MAAQENAPKRTRSNAKSVLTDLYIEVDDLMLRKKQDLANFTVHTESTAETQEAVDTAAFVEACEQVKRLIREKM